MGLAHGLRPEAVNHPVLEGREEVGIELLDGGGRVALVPEGHKKVLHHFLGLVGAAELAAGVRVQLVPVPLVDFGKGLLVVLGQGAEQRGLITSRL